MTVIGRHVDVSERFRRLSADKLTKVEQYAPRTQRIEVVVSEETRREAPKGSQRVEITCLAKGPVIRAEAYADDKYAALDLALGKLSERLRRAHDRRKARRHTSDFDQATSGLQVATLGGPGASQTTGSAASSASTGSASDVDADDGPEACLGAQGDSPVHVREKTHTSCAMSLDQALYNMELVGHDFYLFHNKDTGRPSVVYRRRGWDYGVLHLDVVDELGVDDEATAV